MSYRYFIEHDGDRLIRDKEGALVQRYDIDSNSWVEDVEMAQIYFGGIPVRSITEEEANEIIRKKQNSNH
ncbi:MAG: hypothetical protein SOW48_03575 [Peptoniphilaceae bacterium]|nr:hypothetical protein [Peptoniphilaceae bacterium]MDD7433946.1 hypothetical protein [Peptoniphilaceae bacterium]MDY3075708.1 hypothetical protein [Peptoniphilaceae bacterium]MDY3986349.1 hypothetical protein [Peptoniphilaceae bacterium]